MGERARRGARVGPVMFDDEPYGPPWRCKCGRFVSDVRALDPVLADAGVAP